MTHPLVQLALKAASTEAFAYQGVRKIINGMTWQLPWRSAEARHFLEGEEEHEPMAVVDFAQLGYGANKFKQLVRNYVNEEEFARVRSVLERRRDQTFTSVALSMRGAKKDARSQGWCILSIVVTRGKKGERIEVQYRSTELTLKFGGDLCFLPWVFEKLGVDPEVVTFRFANCYLSGVYLPYLVTFVKDPVPLLHKLWKNDPEFCASATRFFLRSSMKKNQFFPYSPENVAHRFGWERLSTSTMARIRDYLTEQHKKFGPLDWIQHHKKGDYVPRGQRGENE